MQDAQSELFEVNPTLNSSSKICSKCNERKPIEDFHKRKVSRDGLNHVCKTCASVYAKEKYNDIDYRLSKVVTNATKRAKKNNLPIDIDVEYLKTIMTEKCPVFDIKLNWDTSGEGITDNSPSLDRVIPELGYVKGNVVFLSHLASRIKNDVTEKEWRERGGSGAWETWFSKDLKKENNELYNNIIDNLQVNKTIKINVKKITSF